MTKFCTKNFIIAIFAITLLLFGSVLGAFQSHLGCLQGECPLLLAQAQAQQSHSGDKEAQEQPSQPQARYLGNAYNHTFHVPGCRYYGCKNCTTRAFDSREEAIKAGYKPCKVCRP